MNARAKSTLLDSWNRYLDDLDRCAATPMPLESQGKLVRVAGLVLEAAGLRLPVGAVCEIHSESRVEKTPVLGEVVGVHIARHLLVDGVYDTAGAAPILRGGGPADYFEITPDSRFQMRRPAWP